MAAREGESERESEERERSLSQCMHPVSLQALPDLQNVTAIFKLFDGCGKLR
jgi:hypothetical protein